MNRFRRKLTGGLTAGVAVGLIATQLSGCAQDAHASSPEVAKTTQALEIPDAIKSVVEQCGLDVNCEGGGIAEGRASISGVPSVDAFFAAVVNFQTKADASSGAITAELNAIRGDFGLAADADIGASIKAMASGFIEGEIEIVAEPARCQVTAEAAVQASARCEASAMPPMAMVECKGSCEVEASANVECGADVDVSCSFQGPSVECTGSCTGTCTLEAGAAASCEGTCNGGCQGDCSLMNAEGECQGKCDGTCMGSCEVEMKAAAECEGSCNGECTVTNPSGGCEGAASARCEGSADAMVECTGRCDGEVTPPSAKAECKASAKAEASFNAECTPPSVDVRYELRAGASVDVEAQAKFEAGLRNLEVRLPKLLASLKGANIAITAAGELGVAGKAAVESSIDAIGADADIKTVVGLSCAFKELGAVEGAISGATEKLTGSIEATAELTAAFNL